MYKVSVIIPVYNTEKYIEKCLKSVIKQTLRDIEIIVVNDGSIDRSSEILKKYKEYNNIKIINKKNEGQGIARNEAIKIANGEYLAFVDSDDYIERDMFEEMYSKATKYNLDIVICNYRYVFDNSNEVLSSNVKLNDNEIIDSRECIKRFLIENTIEGFSWNKLFKKDLFVKNNIEYPHIKYEDIPTIVNIIKCSQKIGFINKEFYNYLIRKGSTTSTKTLSNSKDYIKSISMVKESILNKKISLNSELTYYYYYRFINELYSMWKTYKNNKEFSEYINEISKEISSIKTFNTILLNNKFSIKVKLKLLIKTILINFNFIR